ncbi:hypothetical protein HU200_058863 [Digitaria exilis]|uniref:Tyrosinase copper-binding domain-containing protein n=1 Tax=Digitaria exilis TaxID=1010633 RepID=A0A835A952_9POAL|nr:hypothetical protein HU200_058863 [Digitaria exilis]
MAVTNGTQVVFRILLCCALVSTVTIFLPLALRPCAHSLSRTILATTGLDPQLICCTGATATKASLPGAIGATVNRAINGGRPIVTDVLRCGEPSLPPHALPPFHCCPLTPPSEAAVVNFTFPNPAEPIRTRRPAHDAGDDMAKLERAVAIMKALPASDPRSFYPAGQRPLRLLHRRSPASRVVAGDAIADPLLVALLPVPPRIPLLLRARRGEASRRPFLRHAVLGMGREGMRAPPEFFSDESSSLYDALRNPRHAPPRVVDLDFWCVEKNITYVEKNVTDAEQVELNLRIMYKAMVTNAPLPSLFHGQPYRAGDREMPGAGTVELALHNVVHEWTGDLERPNYENMGAYYSSARDPIFYPHHANSDRLWEVWRGDAGDERRPRHADFTDPDWLDSSFLFYDEEAMLVRVTVRDVLDVEKLRYTYADVGTPWLDARPPVTAGVSLRRRGPPALESVRFPVFLDAAVSAAVMRPWLPGNVRGRRGDVVEVLVVEGIEADGADFVRFDVYVNAMEHEKVSPGAREAAGSFVSLKQPGMEVVQTSMRVVLDEVMEDLGAEGDDSVTVTLVPVMGKVRIGGLRVVYMAEQDDSNSTHEVHVLR